MALELGHFLFDATLWEGWWWCAGWGLLPTQESLISLQLGDEPWNATLEFQMRFLTETFLRHYK